MELLTLGPLIPDKIHLRESKLYHNKYSTLTLTNKVTTQTSIGI